MLRPATSLALYVSVFACLGFRWLLVFSSAVPVGDFFAASTATDDRLIPWALAWVSHALVRDPWHLFDANIYYPAPAQLTGSEHFLSTALAATPVLWLTGNALAAANIVAFATYPIAALAMERLLLRLGCGGGVAWVGGLLYALGPGRVPANLQILQYPNLYLPVVALAILRLRDHPTRGAAVWLALATAAGLFSSYYMAAMVMVFTVLWIVMDVGDPGPRRRRVLTLAAAALGSAVLALIVVSLPYLSRPEVGAVASRSQGPVVLWASLLVRVLPLWFGVAALILAVLGLLALGGGTDASRRLARRGLAFALIGALLMVPLPDPTGVFRPALGFLRFPWRLVVLAGFGTALLGAAALERGRGALGPRYGRVLVLAAGVVVLVRGTALVARGTSPVSAAREPMYAAVALHAGAESGALLELPFVDASGANLQADAMLGSTRHWRPLAGGYTGYPPAHRESLEAAVRRLPAPEALDDLVDMAHVRWMLLHPASRWAEPAVRSALIALPGVESVLQRDGWDLLRVSRPVRHPAWFAAIAAGWKEGQTALGTPIVRITRGAAGAEITTSRAPEQVEPGAMLNLDLRITNRGSTPWPVSIPSWEKTSPRVQLRASLVRFPAREAEAARSYEFALPRDLPAGESVQAPIALKTPFMGGLYRVEVFAEQVGGERFDGPSDRPLALDLRVGR